MPPSASRIPGRGPFIARGLAGKLAVLLAFLVVLAGAMRPPTASALDDGLARTPPMGWNSWNRFGCNISERLLRETADALVESGMRDAGYEYVNLDDCWQAPARDAQGNIQADPRRFPSGIKALADYVHARGLKLGIYSSAGAYTCQRRPGSYGHEREDAARFASWGVDYLKYDWCFHPQLNRVPDLDKITVAIGDSGEVDYEAESGANTLGGSAAVVPCEACSDGHKVAGVGNKGGTLRFNEVTVPADGEYRLTFHYVDNEISFPGDPKGSAHRVAHLSVNGMSASKVEFQSTGDPFTLRTLSVAVRLEAGANTLRLHNHMTDRENADLLYTRMGDALKATRRPIIFSICEWGENKPWTWGADIGHLWRTVLDIEDNWKSVTSILDRQAGLGRHAGPGHWNDPDMLEVGNGGMSDTEYRAHFSLWSLLSAPLLAGNDVRRMSKATREILTNKGVIAVNQDRLGVQGRKLRDDGDLEVWAKPLAGGDLAVVLLNRGARPATIGVRAQDLGLSKRPSYAVRDLWAHTASDSKALIGARVPAHGVSMLRVRADKRNEIRQRPTALPRTGGGATR